MSFHKELMRDLVTIVFISDFITSFLRSSGRDKVLILWDLHSATAINTIPVYEVLEDVVLLPNPLVLPGNPRVSETDICVASAGENG